ncbi:MAG: hypothetical protein OEY89_04795 [Gammaproteobacteria bacterium]|nr:hypothetical protein [Gammaproteobacteria bacterium]
MKTYFLVLALTLLQGCTVYARSTYVFEKNEGIPTVLYDLEAIDLAEKVQSSLASSISSIARQQYTEFKDLDELKIYLFSTKERYSNLSGSTPKARGSAIKDEIYISPIIRERIETLESILVHELSHIHIRQYINLNRHPS